VSSSLPVTSEQQPAVTSEQQPAVTSEQQPSAALCTPGENLQLRQWLQQHHMNSSSAHIGKKGNGVHEICAAMKGIDAKPSGHHITSTFRYTNAVEENTDSLSQLQSHQRIKAENRNIWRRNASSALIAFFCRKRSLRPTVEYRTKSCNINPFFPYE